VGVGVARDLRRAVAEDSLQGEDVPAAHDEVASEDVAEVVDAGDLLPEFELAAVAVMAGQERPGEEPAVRRHLRAEGIRPTEHRGVLLLDPGEMERFSSVGLLAGVDEVFFAHEWNDEFAERLVAGFRAQYDELWHRGLRGDDLYIALADWASGGPLAPFPRKAAGVAIISYLFHTCDVFEREPQDAASD